MYIVFGALVYFLVTQSKIRQKLKYEFSLFHSPSKREGRCPVPFVGVGAPHPRTMAPKQVGLDTKYSSALNIKDSLT